MATIRIESAFQLLVEGNDPRNFFEKSSNTSTLRAFRCRTSAALTN